MLWFTVFLWNSSGTGANIYIFIMWLGRSRKKVNRSRQDRNHIFIRQMWWLNQQKNYKSLMKFESDLAKRPPLELGTQVMKSSRNECSLLCRCRGRLPSRASSMVGEWDRASPFPRIPECALHTWQNQRSQTVMSFFISGGRPNYLQMLLIKYLKWSLLKNLQIFLNFISLGIGRNVLLLITIIKSLSMSRHHSFKWLK